MITPAEPPKGRTDVDGLTTAKIAVRLKGLWKTYPGNVTPAVQDLSLDIYDGEILTLLGPRQAALFIGEPIEYQVEVDGQGAMLSYGERHEPVEEGGKVWLNLRPDGHSAWASDWLPRAE
jgi:hypothetical protein